MSEITATEEIVFSYPMRSDRVEVLYMRYSGGGECWEFRVFQNDTAVYTSENGYGNPTSAASDGFKWLADNEY